MARRSSTKKFEVNDNSVGDIEGLCIPDGFKMILSYNNELDAGLINVSKALVGKGVTCSIIKGGYNQNNEFISDMVSLLVNVCEYERYLNNLNNRFRRYLYN